MQYVKPKIARERLGIKNETLRKWADAGTIKYIRGGGGGRLYNIDNLVPSYTSSPKNKPRKKYIYCRVSSGKQKDDLERQISFMQEKYPDHEVVKEIASGINFKRKILNRLLDEAIKGDIQEIVVAHKDRLCRIAWEHFSWLFTRLGVNLIVDNREEHSPESELSDDLLSIIHVFSCRHYGQRRKYTTKKVQGSEDKVNAETGEYENITDEQEE